MSVVNVREEGNAVLLFVDGRLAFRVNCNEALEIANALTSVARIIDERVQHERIVFEQALLMRSGAPFGLVTRYNPDLMKLARKEAAWNSDLRRYIRSAPESPANVYALGLYHAPPEEKPGDPA